MFKIMKFVTLLMTLVLVADCNGAATNTTTVSTLAADEIVFGKVEPKAFLGDKELAAFENDIIAMRMMNADPPAAAKPAAAAPAAAAPAGDAAAGDAAGGAAAPEEAKKAATTTAAGVGISPNMFFVGILAVALQYSAHIF